MGLGGEAAGRRRLRSAPACLACPQPPRPRPPCDVLLRLEAPSARPLLALYRPIRQQMRTGLLAQRDTGSAEAPRERREPRDAPLLPPKRPRRPDTPLHPRTPKAGGGSGPIRAEPGRAEPPAPRPGCPELGAPLDIAATPGSPPGTSGQGFFPPQLRRGAAAI